MQRGVPRLHRRSPMRTTISLGITLMEGWPERTLQLPPRCFGHLYIEMTVFQTFAAKLTRSTSLTSLTKHLEFEVTAPRFGFVAGQWLSMKANMPDGEEITRAYSIASPPNGDNRFALC